MKIVLSEEEMKEATEQGLHDFIICNSDNGISKIEVDSHGTYTIRLKMKAVD